MGKRLTQKQRDNKLIEKIVKRIKSIERIYGVQLTRYACQRYSLRKSEEQRLRREIKEHEAVLEALKKKVKR